MTKQGITDKLTIWLIGCGKMGSAMAQGWNKAGLIQHLVILDPHEPPHDIATLENVQHVTTPQDLQTVGHKPDCIMLAVKPQMMRDVCEALKPVIPGSSTLLSIAAGTPIALFEEIFGNSQPVIRAMPNTPAAISKGITAAMPNPHVTTSQKEQAENLLNVSGQLLWVNDEERFHAITALSGSGPAYIFLMIEALSKAGETIGLDAETAQTLARQTVIGSAALAEQESGTEAAQLRKNVTSPGGTTQAALDVLMDGRFDDLLIEALKAAQSRSRELSHS